MRVVYTLIALAIALSDVCAASKKPVVWKKSTVVKAYKSYMKDKKYAMAKSEIDGAFGKFAEAKNDAELYSLKANALNELIVAENRKIYLNQKPDTLKYFSLLYELYDNCLDGDSLEQHYIFEMHEKGKKANVKYRYNFGMKMSTYRKNLLQAGKFYYVRRDYVNAFKYLDMYVGTKESPVFTDKKGRPLTKDEDDLVEVSKLAVLSAYGSNNPNGVLKFLSEGAKDESVKEKLLEIGFKSALEVNDTLSMVRLLEYGFECFPENNNFFLSLVKHYNSIGKFELAWEKAVQKVKAHPNERDWWFVKGKEEMLMEKFSDAIESFERCTVIKADDAEAFSSLGNIHLHYAHDLYAHFTLPVSDPNYSSMKSAISDEYKKACDFFEAARRFDANNHELWLEGLRECYFKLNKGQELKKLDAATKNVVK